MFDTKIKSCPRYHFVGDPLSSMLAANPHS
jgi:hypothetical protein